MIENIDLDEFHEINYCNKTVRKLFTLRRCYLVCSLCCGTGKTDWISKVIKSERSYRSKKFERDPKAEILTLSRFSNKHKKEILIDVSSPVLTMAEERCEKCYGSGLNMVKSYELTKSRKIKYC